MGAVVEKLGYEGHICFGPWAEAPLIRPSATSRSRLNAASGGHTMSMELEREL